MTSTAPVRVRPSCCRTRCDCARRAGLAGKTAADSAEFCEARGCGEPIPDARRRASPGCKYCLACQAQIEKSNRGKKSPMSFTDMTFSFEAMRWIVLTAIGIYAWFIGRQSASSAELLELRTRLTTLEAQMARVPSQSQLHELVATVARPAGPSIPWPPGSSPWRAACTASRTTC